MGVPVITMRIRALSFLISRVCLVPGFLMACASSRMTQSHLISCRPLTRAAMPYVVMVRNARLSASSSSNTPALRPWSSMKSSPGANLSASRCQLPRREAGSTRRALAVGFWVRSLSR